MDLMAKDERPSAEMFVGAEGAISRKGGELGGEGGREWRGKGW